MLETAFFFQDPYPLCLGCLYIWRPLNKSCEWPTWVESNWKWIAPHCPYIYIALCVYCAVLLRSRQWKRWGGKKDRKERECVVGDKREITTLRWWQHTKENLWISDDVHRERGRLDFRERKRLPLLYYHFEGLFWTLYIYYMECWPISSLLAAPAGCCYSISALKSVSSWFRFVRLAILTAASFRPLVITL